jgi:hypothetical protein
MIQSSAVSFADANPSNGTDAVEEGTVTTSRESLVWATGWGAAALARWPSKSGRRGSAAGRAAKTLQTARTSPATAEVVTESGQKAPVFNRGEWLLRLTNTRIPHPKVRTFRNILRP